jgi:broad specificity phosphatase PhoE
MPVAVDGNHYESEMHYQLDLPTVMDDGENRDRYLSQGGQKREPLRVTITPHMQAGESEFDTPLNEQEQESYSKKYGLDANRDYDMQGFHKYNPDFTPGEGQHYPDTYKKPNHPTFSNESIYHGGKYEGGQWQQNPDKSYQFTPGRTNLENHSPEELQDYFNKVEPGNKLNLPQEGLTESKTIHFIRHGATPENADNTIRDKDTELTDEGRGQAAEAGRQLKEKGVNAIVSSTLPRAMESAHIIASKLGIIPQFDPRLNTWGMGSLEGQPCSEENLQVIKDHVAKTPDKPLGGEESFNDFKNRSFAGIRDAILNNKDKELGIVTHSKTEGALKSWEATGQDNPDIDPEVVNATPDKPGSIEKFTMQPDSTIMQNRNQQVAENFSERFGKWAPILGSGNPPAYSHPGMFQTSPGPNREPFQGIPEEGKGTEPVFKKDISPIQKLKTSFSQEESIEALARKHQIEGSKLREILLDIKPEDIIGTHELGMAMPAGRLLQERFIEGLKKMIDSGKSFSEIGKTLGMTRDAVAGLVKRNNLKSFNKPTTTRSKQLHHTPLLDLDFDL